MVKSSLKITCFGLFIALNTQVASATEFNCPTVTLAEMKKHIKVGVKQKDIMAWMAKNHCTKAIRK